MRTTHSITLTLPKDTIALMRKWGWSHRGPLTVGSVKWWLFQNFGYHIRLVKNNSGDAMHWSINYFPDYKQLLLEPRQLKNKLANRYIEYRNSSNKNDCKFTRIIFGLETYPNIYFDSKIYANAVILLVNHIDKQSNTIANVINKITPNGVLSTI